MVVRDLLVKEAEAEESRSQTGFGAPRLLLVVFADSIFGKACAAQSRQK